MPEFAFPLQWGNSGASSLDASSGEKELNEEPARTAAAPLDASATTTKSPGAWIDSWVALRRLTLSNWSDLGRKPWTFSKRLIRLTVGDQTENIEASIFDGPLIVMALPPSTAKSFLESRETSRPETRGIPLRSSVIPKLSASLVYAGKGPAATLYAGHEKKYPLALVLAVPPEALVLASWTDINSPTTKTPNDMSVYLALLKKGRAFADRIRSLYHDRTQRKHSVFELERRSEETDASRLQEALRRRLGEIAARRETPLDDALLSDFAEVEPALILIELLESPLPPASSDDGDMVSVATPQDTTSMLEDELWICFSLYRELHQAMGVGRHMSEEAIEQLSSCFTSLKRPGVLAAMTTGHNELILDLGAGTVEIMGVGLVVSQDLFEDLSDSSEVSWNAASFKWEEAADVLPVLEMARRKGLRIFLFPHDE
ncbi:Hypothetical protein A7982_02320 [Minicystis rosea]|nr:Hypothetical protein A7982_02320 [Minicystis rosea]